MAQRGSYAKGVAKREEILQRALDVVGREGYRGASVKEIADAVGLSPAGLLHYFDSKEELFAAILHKRDEHDRILSAGVDRQALREAFLGLLRHNAEVPGLVELFSRLAVDAADPDHPAHAFFRDREQRLIDTITEVAAGSDSPPPLPPEAMARIIQALADGLQLQWLRDPSVDMAGLMDAALSALAGRPGSSAA